MSRASNTTPIGLEESGRLLERGIVVSDTPTSIDPTVVTAYRETEYRVHSDPPVVLLVGTRNSGLRSLHERHGVASSVFITAFNPYSRELDPAENASRQASLAAELRRLNLAHIPGIGQHPSNGWPGEPSFLSLGLDLEAAKALGIRWEQNAIVWTGADGVPQLLLLR